MFFLSISFEEMAVFTDMLSNIKLYTRYITQKGDRKPSRKMIEGKRPLTEKTKL